MRQGHQNKRGRGRSRKSSNPLSRNYESNGPDVKIRGSASHVAEKYASLARDAQSSGDPVSAENYWQHAEHYYRIIQAAEAQAQSKAQNAQAGGNANNNNGQGRRQHADNRQNQQRNRNANASNGSANADNSPEAKIEPGAAPARQNDQETAKPARRAPRTPKAAANPKPAAAASDNASNAEPVAKKAPKKASAKSSENNSPPEDVSA